MTILHRQPRRAWPDRSKRARGCTRQSDLGFREAVAEQATLVVGDARLVSRLIEEHGIDAIMHFAVSSVVPESIARAIRPRLSPTVIGCGSCCRGRPPVPISRPLSGTRLAGNAAYRQRTSMQDHSGIVSVPEVRRLPKDFSKNSAGGLVPNCHLVAGSIKNVWRIP